jgi:hypothetical protein
MENKNLLDVIGHECATEALGFCVQPSTITNYPKGQLYYWDWEKLTAQPKLESLGYRVIGWMTGEGDYFWSLTRVCYVEKDGVRSEMWYYFEKR